MIRYAGQNLLDIEDNQIKYAQEVYSKVVMKRADQPKQKRVLPISRGKEKKKQQRNIKNEHRRIETKRLDVWQMLL